MSMEASVKNGEKVKIILLGDSAVGKTSLINQYVNKKFQKKTPDFTEPLSKAIEVVQGKPMILQIYDTGGQEHEGRGGLEATFVNNAKACMFVYDVQKPESLQNLENWHNEFRIKVSVPSSLEGFPFVVVGNKVDQVGGNEANHARAIKWCQDKKIEHFLASAKDNIHVVEAFEFLAKLVVKREPKQHLEPPKIEPEPKLHPRPPKVESESKLPNGKPPNLPTPIHTIKPESKCCCTIL